MVDTKDMRRIAALAVGPDGSARLAADGIDRGKVIDAWADEIDAGRNARLVQYRCAALQALMHTSSLNGKTMADIVRYAEDIAHDMLAAERPVKP